MRKWTSDRAFGLLRAGVVQNIDARRFGVHRNTIGSLWRRFQQYVNTRDRNSSYRPRVTSSRQDTHIRLMLFRNRPEIASYTTCNIPGLSNGLREYGMQPRLSVITLYCYHATDSLDCQVACDSEYKTGPISSSSQTSPNITMTRVMAVW